MALTAAQVQNAKPRAAPYKLPDGGGLHLVVTPSGGRLWRFRYAFGGKEKTLSIGPYPTVKLADAREQREAAKLLLRTGRDPSAEKRLRRFTAVTATELTFQPIAERWFAQSAPMWTERHAKDVLGCLVADVFPTIGALPLKGITPPIVLQVLRPIEARPALETARRTRQRISAVFVYAIASGLADADPAAIVKGAMAPMRKGRQPAIVDLDEARKMLQRAEAVPSFPITKLALRLLALTAVRPGELREARWAEFEGLDGPAPTWRLPGVRMKMRREHLVPLSRQAVEVLTVARGISGRGPIVFPNSRFAHKPMSENAIGYLLNRAGYHHKHVPHGWRSTFSSAMNERFRADQPILDLMLAHAPKDRVEAAYNRALHMERRRELAQAWADLLLADAAPADQLLLIPKRDE